MSRSGPYGQSFTKKLFQDGKYDEALAEAGRSIARDEADPEPLFERAQVLSVLNRHEDAVADLLRARELDAEAGELDEDALEDALFSSLVAWGQEVAARDPEAAVTLLGRYTALYPAGGHGKDVADWTRRFRGERTTWTKNR